MSEKIASATRRATRRKSVARVGALVVSVLALAITAPAIAQQAKPASKAKQLTSKAQAKSTATKAASAVPTTTPATMETWHCELGNSFRLGGDLARDLVLTINWQGRNYKLPRQETMTGAERYFDAASGMDLVIIPSKAMLLNSRQGQRLADECKTASMNAGEPAPTHAEALRAPVIDPLTPQGQTNPPGFYPARPQ